MMISMLSEVPVGVALAATHPRPSGDDTEKTESAGGGQRHPYGEWFVVCTLTQPHAIVSLNLVEK